MMQSPISGFPTLVIFLTLMVIVLVPIVQIIHKAGYSRIWFLVYLIPVVNIAFLWIFAFSRWPVETRAMAKAAE